MRALLLPSKIDPMRKASFPIYADPCGWNVMLPPRTPKPRATGDISVRYAIVGAGFTGVAAARRLAELDPSAEIAVLEGLSVGEGSSGRNSGFANPRDSANGLSPDDVRRAEALNRFTGEGFAWLEKLMAEHGISCDLERTGRITGAATEVGEAKVRGMVEGARKLGVPCDFLDTDAIERRIGTRYYRCAHFTEDGYLLQPAALIRGLADSLPANVRLHEETAVTGLERSGDGWLLRTPEARISARTVILAANPALPSFGYLGDRLVTIYTYAAITEAMSAGDAAHLGAMSNWGLLPGHRLGTTVRRVGKDRLMVRSLYSHGRPLASEEVRAALTSCFHRRYPMLSHVRLEHVWGGTTALTMNGSPWWGKLDDTLYTSAGCNGSGLVKGTVLGKRLAETLARGDRQDDLQQVYGRANWVAPEPFRSIGFHVVSAIQRRKAGAEM